MSNLFWLTDEQMACLQSYFPKSYGRQRVVSVVVNRNGRPDRLWRKRET